jgi:hypothetical protein
MSQSNNYYVLMDLNYVLTKTLIKIYLIFIRKIKYEKRKKNQISRIFLTQKN